MPPLFDLLILLFVGLLVLTVNSRRRLGAMRTLERIKREVQGAMRSVQGVPTQGEMTQTRPPPKPVSKIDSPPATPPSQPFEWHGLEGMPSSASTEPPKRAETAKRNPLPTISANPLVQAVAMSEVLAKPKGARRHR